jgi:hypothetical protein
MNCRLRSNSNSAPIGQQGPRVCFRCPHIHPRRCATLVMTAVSPAAEPSSSSIPAKQHKRVGWQWQCPACSNRQRTGPGLLQHMQKCCGDLLPSTYSTDHIKSLLAAELQRQQHTQPDASTHQPGGDADIQAVVTAACQQEHTLRMRALHLRFIDDSKQPLSAAAAAAAAEAGAGSDDEEEPPDTTPTPEEEQPAQPDSANPSSSSNSQQPAVSRKRGRQRTAGRTPVRSIEQVMQEMQLPKTRCAHDTQSAAAARTAGWPPTPQLLSAVRRRQPPAARTHVCITCCQTC